MKVLPWVLAFALMFSALPAAGEFYKYVDENGDTRFTDDINQVPPAQRDRVSSYVESQSQQNTEPAEGEINRQKPVDPPSEKPKNAADIYAEDKPEEGYFQKTRKELDEMKNQLDAEYKAIIAEKEKLTAERETAKSREQIQAYNQKVEQLNERAAAYETKGAEYSQRVEEFNARIAEENSKMK